MSNQNLRLFCIGDKKNMKALGSSNNSAAMQMVSEHESEDF